MNEEQLNSFRDQLDQHYAWPSLYRFKFIVPVARVDEVRNMFPGHTLREKSSGQGNYKGITVDIMAHSSDFVIQIYRRAAEIEGIVAL